MVRWSVGDHTFVCYPNRPWLNDTEGVRPTLSSFEEIQTEFLEAIHALDRETRIVYEELVLPGWGSPDRHGYPRTLYGFVMNVMSLVDRLSCYRDGEAGNDQTKRMRGLLIEAGYSSESAAVCVQLWRHTLMHTGLPATVTESKTGVAYRWLLHWADHLPREQHMTLSDIGPDERVLNVGALYLVKDLASVATDLFLRTRDDPRGRGLLEKVHREIANRQRF